MAEPLKNFFGPEVPKRLAATIKGVHPSFDSDGFLASALDGLEELELTPRARHVSAALAHFLPPAKEAIPILTASLGPEIAGAELTGMDSFRYLPLVYFVAEQGIGCFEESMQAQYELTKRFTAEFSIRSFIEHDPERTLERLAEWSRDPNVHVRRLVSEGTRPRLPWAPRLKAFQADPSLILPLLETLKDDPEEYVRRSVANNLNDIAKDHPDLVVEVAQRWWRDATPDRKRLIRHGLRTLLKSGHPGALAVLGFDANSPVRLRSTSCDPELASIGTSVRLTALLHNPSDHPGAALVDFRVHFVKSRGGTSPKVFKGSEMELAPGESRTVRKRISLAQHSTRTHYPGVHRVEILVNGIVVPGTVFEVVSGTSTGI